MDISVIGNAFYMPTASEARQSQAAAADEAPRDAVDSAGDEDTRGVNAANESVGADTGSSRQRGAGNESASREEERAQVEAEQQAAEVEKLQARDREVRMHEQAHLAAAGQYAKGGISFSYTRGPDGRQYATGGEVGISTSTIPGDPEATLQKMERVRRAALAPAEPSPQDQRVAAEAGSKAAKARQDLSEQKREEAQEAFKAYGDRDAAGASERGGVDLTA